MARQLLLGIEHRGQHATGAAWRETDQTITIQKRDLTASKWVEHLSMPRKTQTAVLHTRFWTQGKPEVNANNHPIQSGSIVGVHNGTVWNDDWLYQDMPGVKRHAEVDSEAIFALLACGANHYKDVTHDVDLLEEVQGVAAIAYMDLQEDDGILHVARLASSPLVIAQSKAGSFVCGSTKDAVVNAMLSVGLDVEYLDASVAEGTYFRIDRGLIVEEKRFEVDEWAGKWNRKAVTKVTTPKDYGRTGATKKADSDPDWCYQCGEWADWCDHAGTYANEKVTVMEDGDTTQALDPERDLAKVLIEGANLYVDHQVRPVGDVEWESRYGDRHRAVEVWATAAQGYYQEDNEAFAASARSVGADLRPGDWVRSTLLGVECYGQVVEVPQTFPQGDYLLRLLPAKDPTSLDGMEAVLVARKVNQFTIVGSATAAAALAKPRQLTLAGS